MSDLTRSSSIPCPESDLTAPGDILGLLRRASPVLHDGERCVALGEPYLAPSGICVAISGQTSVQYVPASDVRLDLSDKTGLMHAVWWLDAIRPGAFWNAAMALHLVLIDNAIGRARHGNASMVEHAHIRRILLHLAGRES